MNRRPLLIRPDAYPPALNVVGTDVIVLASKQDTQGLEFTYQSGESGMGPPPHSHEWDEAFFVIRGSVEFTYDGKTELCTNGTLFFVPSGTIHAFQYGPDGGEMIELTGAGSRAAQLFTAIDTETLQGSPKVEKIVEIMGQNGVTVHL